MGVLSRTVPLHLEGEGHQGQRNCTFFYNRIGLVLLYKNVLHVLSSENTSSFIEGSFYYIRNRTGELAPAPTFSVRRVPVRGWWLIRNLGKVQASSLRPGAALKVSF